MGSFSFDFQVARQAHLLFNVRFHFLNYRIINSLTYHRPHRDEHEYFRPAVLRWIYTVRRSDTTQTREEALDIKMNAEAKQSSETTKTEVSTGLSKLLISTQERSGLLTEPRQMLLVRKRTKTQVPSANLGLP